MKTASATSETDIILLAIAKEKLSFGHLAQGVDREELQALLQTLRAEEEDHRTRLRTLLYGLEADRPVVATRLPATRAAAWLRSIRRMIPAAHLH